MATQRLCAACSTKLLVSFAAACGTRIRLPALSGRMRLDVSALSARGLHHTGVRSDPTIVPLPSQQQFNTSPEPPANIVPWFLRMETPQAPKHPLADQKTLPELPENPPPELSEILHQLSEDHGITDLNILDLRPLDPPPAIGASIMLVGTARSVRHLHATADKICRYMRTTYKWTPFADGLLGRNELRLINRRKQRRGKVISTQLGEVDEAAGSGWICVHGGTQKLVVQLFVQAKRDEMDIDGFWRAILDRNERHRVKEAERKAERERKWALEDVQDVIQEKTTDTMGAIQPDHTKYNLSPSASGLIVQTRSLHKLTTSTPGVSTPPNVINHSAFPEFVRTGDLASYLTTLSPLPEDIASSTILQAHIDALKSPLVSPAALMGTGFGDQTSTPFLRTFYKALASAAPGIRGKYEIELLKLTNTHKPELYPVHLFLPFIRDLRDQGRPLQVEHYYIVLSYLAVCSELRPPVESGWLDVTDARLAIMDLCLEDLKSHTSPEEAGGIENRPEFRYAIFLALLQEPVSGIREAIINHDTEATIPLDLGLSQKFGHVTFHPKIWRGKGYGSLDSSDYYSYTLREHHLDFITALALGGKWNQLWEFWKRLPLHGVARDSEYYKLIFGLIVLEGSQREAIYCARWLGPEAMTREYPSINPKEPKLSNAFSKVLDIADGEDNSTEWAGARKLCMPDIRR